MAGGGGYGQSMGQGQPMQNLGNYGFQQPGQTYGGYGQQYQQQYGQPYGGQYSPQRQQMQSFNPWQRQGMSPMGQQSAAAVKAAPSPYANDAYSGGSQSMGALQPAANMPAALPSSVMGQQSAPTQMRSAPQPAQQAYQNASQNAAFQPMRASDSAFAGRGDPYAGNTVPGAGPVEQKQAIPGYGSGESQGVPSTLDPRSMNWLIGALGGGNFQNAPRDIPSQQAAYNNYYYGAYQNGQAPGGPTNWDNPLRGF